MAEYLVHTPKGDKEPFSLDHLEKLVAAGRLPRSMSVTEVESGLAIPLDDLLPEPAEEPEPTPAPPVPRAPTPARSAPPQSRPAPKRRPPAPRGKSPPAAPSAGRFVPARKKSPAATIVLSVFVGFVALAGVWLLLREDPGLVIADYQQQVSGNYSTKYSEVLPQTPEYQEMSPLEQELIRETFREFEEIGGVVKVRVTAKRIKVSIEGEVMSDTPLEVLGRAGEGAFRILLDAGKNQKAIGVLHLTSTGIVIDDRDGFEWKMTRLVEG